MLNAVDGACFIRQRSSGYQLVADRENWNAIYNYGAEEPEFHAPTLHTPAYCEDKLQAMAAGSADLIIDDPPYGNTQQDWDAEPDWSELGDQFARVLADDGLLVLFGQQPSLIPAYQALTGAGLEFRFELIWEKKNPSWVSHYQPLPTHENIWVFSQAGVKVSETMTGDGFSSMTSLKRDGVFVCGGCEAEIGRGGYEVTQSPNSQQHKGAQQTGSVSTSDGERYPKSVLEFPSAIDEEQLLSLIDRLRGAIEDGASTEQVQSLLQFNEAHPALTDDPSTSIVGQKPWRLIRWLVVAFSERGDTVLDPHMGSGTVPDVCVPLCRHGIGIEASLRRGEQATERVNGTLEKLRDLKHGTVVDTPPSEESAVADD
jgi:hypothetical protein